MSYRVECPNCKAGYTAHEKHLGKKMKCQKCGHRFPVQFEADWISVLGLNEPKKSKPSPPAEPQEEKPEKREYKVEKVVHQHPSEEKKTAVSKIELDEEYQDSYDRELLESIVDNQNSNNKLLMISGGVIVALLMMCVFLIGQHSGQQKHANVVQEEPELKWFEGGTLHQETLKVWAESTPENRLATCSDIIANLYNTGHLCADLERQLDENYEVTLRVHSASLMAALDNLAESDDSHHMIVSEASAYILVMCGLAE